MEKSITHRSVYWDNIKGILILFTVFAHIIYDLQDSNSVINSIVDYIYMFHMPAFVFISGYFGKSERSYSFEGIIKLIFLYFIFNSTMGFIYGFYSILTPKYSYWYLIALIVWRLTAHHIAKFKKITIILFFIAIMCGYFESIDNTFAAARIISFYPWYMTGYLLSKEKSNKLVNKKYSKRIIPGIGVASITALLAFISYKIFKFSDNELIMVAYSRSIDAMGRIVLFTIAFLSIYSLRLITPDRKIPLITMFGRNSLWIFIIHRPFAIILGNYIESLPIALLISAAAEGALLLCLLFGNEIITKFMNSFMNKGAEIFTLPEKTKFNLSKLISLLVCFGFVNLALSSPVAKINFSRLFNNQKNTVSDNEENDQQNDTADQNMIYPVMTADQKKRYDNAFRITFSGDLILLEDQVKRGYNGKTYDFSEVFEYAKTYISSADYAIGVFEGPMAGEEAGYSTSNFDDGKELYLNFPDEFGIAVKNAGFDLVTTANNHLLDKGENGALRTLEVLDRIGLDHTGSYKSIESKKKDHIKLVEIQEIKIAFLSYTYGSNYIENEELVNGRYSYITSVISGTEGKMFESLKTSVEQDFVEAKKLSPDLIVVLPHIGTQFSNDPDEEQEIWFDIFKKNGADIILGDHPHVVEPAILEEYNGKKVFTAYCPGNFANEYRNNQGDTSMLTDVYIDRSTKKVIGGSIVPLYTYASADNNYKAVPIYTIVTDTELRNQLTTDDIERSANSNNIITKTVFGSEMDISSVTERYYFNESGFLRTPTRASELTEQQKNSILYKALVKPNHICFIGDSVTEGTKNGGCPWYEPIASYFEEKTIINYSKGGCTVSYMVDHADEIPTAELYVIALGTNDVRYRDITICAMTPESYIEETDRLKNKLLSKSPDAEFVFIAPWYSVDGDPLCKMSYKEKTAMNNEYSASLESYCAQNKLLYINANKYIENILNKFPNRIYLLDHIHPNSSKGVILYSEAVLSVS